MPRPISVAKAQQALLAKGFVEKQKQDHLYFFHYNAAGEKTGAYTYFSGGGRKATEVSAQLMGRMRRELHLDTLKQVNDLLTCPMTAAEYVQVIGGRQPSR